MIARCALVCAIALLVSCAPAPPRATVEDRASGDARQSYERGAYRDAARIWQQQALDAGPAQASQFRLYAADAWLLAGDAGASEDVVVWVERDELSPPDAALLNLVRAELALEQGRPVEARQRLDQAGTALPDAYRPRYVSLAGQIQSALGSISSQSVQEAGRMVRELRGYDAGAALALMQQLENVPSRQLAYLSDLQGDPRRAAWFDLALVLRNNLVDGARVEVEVRDWKARHPSAELNTGDALDLWLRYRQEFRPPQRVAVLLPDSGALEAAGAAVRDGIMSAFLQRPSGSTIRFYGTGERTESALAAYFEAADDGAEWIIGPLDRQSVEALLNLAGLATPVLALNELPDGSIIPDDLAQQVYGMSLSQEREAAAIARHMADLGLENAVVLAPENTWGDRIARAFQADFLQDNRQILVAARYLPEENDHSPVLERVLRIDESKARRRQLENRLGIELEFEPVRRSDIDAIFLAASPEQGRLLTPQLRFFDAGNIPTFATSRVYSGRPDPARNQDLDGLTVPLTTWQITHATLDSLPELQSLRDGEFAPLFAIGMDAWNILPWLELMRGDPDFRFSGQSGTFSVAADGNLQREPLWGRFRSGVPVAAETPEGRQYAVNPAR